MSIAVTQLHGMLAKTLTMGQCMNPQVRAGFRLGDFQILPLRNQIIGAQGPVHIQPKAMDVLCCLADDAGEVVERETLLDKVWERTVVTDEVLTRCISELRSALGDSPSQPDYIQTVPKRGYRLVASVIKQAQALGFDESKTGESQSFWSELKRRNVFRVGVAYLAIAWLTIEVAETIFPHLRLPEWLVGFIVIAAVIGFPIALGFAWAFEMTPSGIVLDRPGGQDQPVATQRSRRLDLLTLAALLVAVGVVSYQFSVRDSQPVANVEPSGTRSVPMPSDQPSIAILPFRNAGSISDKAYFADGLAEDLITLLAKVRNLRVSPRTASFLFKEADTELEIIAERLRVGHILEGSVRANDETIIVNVRLFDVSTESMLWSERIVRDQGDIFELQDEIARTVVENLKIEMALDEPAPLMFTPPTENVSAYEFYAQGREYLRRPKSESNLDAAEDLFNRALQLDPEYAAAYALMCETHLARYRLSFRSDTKAFENAEKSCHRALTYDGTITDVHVALGSLYRNSGQYKKAIQELRYAIDQSPQAVQAHLELGAAYRDNLEPENAEETFRAAIDLEPGYWACYSDLGTFLYENERYSEAVQYFETWTELTPDSPSAYNNLAGAFFMLNDYDRSSATWERSLEFGANRSTYTNIGLSYYYTTRFSEAVEMQKKALEIAPTDHRLWGRYAESARFVNGMEQDSQDAYTHAIEFAKQRLQINPKDWYTLGLLALYQSHVGNRTQSLSTLSRAMEIASNEPDLHYLAALVYLEQDNQNNMYSSLRNAFELGFSPRLISADPDLSPIQEQDDFKALLTELEASSEINP